MPVCLNKNYHGIHSPSFLWYVFSEVMHSFDRNMGTHRGISPTEDLESINKYLKYFVLFFSLMEVFFKYIMI